MPRQIGNVPKEKQLIVPLKTYIGRTSLAVPDADTAIMAKVILSTDDLENIWISHLEALVRASEPADDDIVYLILRIGDKGASVPSDTQELEVCLSGALYIKPAYYEISAGGYALKQDPTPIDFDPDIPVLGEFEQLEMWFGANGNIDVGGTVFYQGFYQLEQRVHPNDNAFSDLSWEETIGHLVCQ